MISDTCRCGSTFNVKAGYNSDECERHDAWMEAHKVCREGGGVNVQDKTNDEYAHLLGEWQDHEEG